MRFLRFLGLLVGKNYLRLFRFWKFVDEFVEFSEELCGLYQVS